LRYRKIRLEILALARHAICAQNCGLPRGFQVLGAVRGAKQQEPIRTAHLMTGAPWGRPARRSWREPGGGRLPLGLPALGLTNCIGGRMTGCTQTGCCGGDREQLAFLKTVGGLGLRIARVLAREPPRCALAAVRWPGRICQPFLVRLTCAIRQPLRGELFLQGVLL